MKEIRGTVSTTMEALQPFLMVLSLWGALFTFGLSVPIGAAIGGGTGWAIGTTVGAGVGAMGGGAAASKLYARRQDAKQM